MQKYINSCGNYFVVGGYMRYTRLTYIVFLVCLLVGTSATAVSAIGVSYEIVTESIFPTEQAEYTFTIENQGDITERYRLYTEDPRFIIDYKPNEILLQPNQKEQISMHVSPVAGIGPGTYGVPVVIEAIIGDGSAERTLSLVLKSESQQSFVPAVTVILDIEEKADPTLPVDMRFRFFNKNNLEIDNLSVSYESKFCSGAFSSSLPPSGEAQIERTCTLDRFTPPQEDTIRVSVFANGDQVGALKTFTYSIQEVLQGFEVQKQKDAFFLRSMLAIEATNVANVEQQQTFSVQRNSFQKSFTTIDSDNQVQVQETPSGYDFIVTLPPNTQASFSVETNTRGFFLTVATLVIVVLAILVLYFIFRSPIVVHRTITQMSKNETTKAKVLINIKNRTGRVLEKVRVIERIPAFAEIDTAYEVGTLKPTKVVKHSKKGTLIRWDFTTLEPFEERIITFKTTSKLGIVGKMQLLPTIVKFVSGHGTRTVKFTGKDQ
jgi:hypothetical protein